MISIATIGTVQRDRRVAIQGQSNALGVGPRADLTTPPLSSDSGLPALYDNPFSRVHTWVQGAGEYQPLREQVNIEGIAAHFGPEFGIAVRWMRETVRGDLYIDKQVSDGSAISVFQAGTAFYTENLARAAGADAWLAARNIRPRMAGLVWVQGEANSADSEATYRAALDSLFASRLADGLLASGSIRVMAKIYPGSSAYGAGVAAAEDAYVAANPGVSGTVTYANHFNVDNVHLNAQGQLQLGYDAYSALFGHPTITA